jgi:hypothetical protein
MIQRVCKCSLLLMSFLMAGSVCRGEIVTFYGTTSAGANSPAGLVNQAFNLTLTYTPSATSAGAVLTAANLTIGSTVFTMATGGSPRLTVVNGTDLPGNSNASRDGLTAVFRVATNSSYPAGDTSQGFHTFNGRVYGDVNIDPLLATAGNINALAKNGNVFNGTFSLSSVVDGGETVELQGIAIPEPGSVMLLSGLGVYCGRRILRKRRGLKSRPVEPTGV